MPVLVTSPSTLTFDSAADPSQSFHSISYVTFSSSANFALLIGLVQVQLMLFQSEPEYSNRTLGVLHFVIVQNI